MQNISQGWLYPIVLVCALCAIPGVALISRF